MTAVRSAGPTSPVLRRRVPPTPKSANSSSRCFPRARCCAAPVRSARRRASACPRDSSNVPIVAPATGRVCVLHSAWLRGARFGGHQMPSFSSVVVLGHLTRDPELRYTPSGVAVCDFCLAVNRKYSRKESGDKVEEVAFVDVTVWNRVAEISAEYLKKGRAALVAGHLAQDRWDDQTTGQKRTKLRVVGHTVQFIGGGSQDDAPSEDAVASDEAPAEPAPAPVPPKGPAAKPPAKPRR